jgi:hypothetical protein
MTNKIQLKSASRTSGLDSPIERYEIGKPGCPQQLVIFNGKIYIYNSLGQTIIDGGYISARAIDVQAITTEKLGTGAKKFVHTIEWVATDYNTCSWVSGVISFSDGTDITINAGNTGNITNKNYIYYNGTTTLQKTENYTTAISGNNIALAIVEPNADTNSKCIITPFVSIGTTIDGDTIITGKIESSDGNTYFDLNNDRLVVSDPWNTRVVIGKMADGSYGIKVSLPEYEADTDTNLNHYALWCTSDDTVDNVLIKEKLRGSSTVNASSDVNIAHGLAYVPFCIVFVEVTSGVYIKSGGRPFDSNGFYFTVNSTNLVLHNSSASAKTFKYYIFYDRMI